VADPGFLKKGDCLSFLKRLSGKIKAEKSKYRERSCNPHNPSP